MAPRRPNSQSQKQKDAPIPEGQTLASGVDANLRLAAKPPRAPKGKKQLAVTSKKGKANPVPQTSNEIAAVSEKGEQVAKGKGIGPPIETPADNWSAEVTSLDEIREEQKARDASANKVPESTKTITDLTGDDKA